MPFDTNLLLEAASFAARAHRHQMRKDRVTPYSAHPFRVCLVVRHVFGIDDPAVLAAALLHDTIEDTTTDYDDLAEAFGPDVARWAATLSKDTRLPDKEREEAYCRQLAAAGWQVQVCKLADGYDNLADSIHLDEGARKKVVQRTTQYLENFRPVLKPEAAAAFKLVEARLAEVREGN